MKIDRRMLLTAGAALGAACLPGVRAAGGAVAPGTSVEFEFGGLFALQLWQKTKKAGFLLVTAKEEHVPMLIVQKDQWLQAQSTYAEPQILHIGGVAYAMWSLRDRVLWVADFHTSNNVNTYDSDQAPALTFASANDWEKLDNIADLTVPTRTKPLVVKKPKLVAAKVLLTRGNATGVMPELESERNRWYRFCGEREWRHYSSQVRVSHPLANASQTLTLSIAPIKSGAFDSPIKTYVVPGTTEKQFTKIVLDCSTGAPHVSVMNAAAGQGGAMHFNTFFDLVAKSSTMLEVMQSKDQPTSDPTAQCMPMTIGPDSPYIGCIPPTISQEV